MPTANLLERLLLFGTPLSYGNGADHSTGNVSNNILATNQSPMHVGIAADGTPEPGYSINGAFQSETNFGWQQYNDGHPAPLPQPSQIDIQGEIPTSALRDPSYPPINNTFIAGRYEDLPGFIYLS